MKIGIIDSDSSARNRLRKQLIELEPQSQIFEADSGTSAFDLFVSEDLDVVFIDADLDGLQGTAVAAAAKKLKPKTGIIFAASNSDHAVEAFEIGADDYILKPLAAQRIERALKPFRSSSQSEVIGERLAVSNDHRIVFVDFSSIVYIETSGRGSVIHTKNGDLFENKTIGKYEERLPQNRFLRIHKSFLVNTGYISEIFPWHSGNLGVKMKGFDAVLPVGRNQSKYLRSTFRIQ